MCRLKDVAFVDRSCRSRPTEWRARYNGAVTVARNIDIAEVLRDARLGDLRTLAEEPASYDELHSATSALFDLLDSRDVDYVLVGGLAVLHYLPGRNTRDIDLILAPSDFEQMRAIIRELRERLVRFDERRDS